MKEVPHMEISGYIHNEQGENLAMINNRLVYEGDEVSSGLRLEKIRRIRRYQLQGICVKQMTGYPLPEQALIFPIYIDQSLSRFNPFLWA
jgi:hypothetical protein